MFSKIAVLLVVGLLGWAYQATEPSPPKICGSPGGPPVTAPRIKLKDGRHLAYVERGVVKEVAKYKIIIVHGICTSKDLFMPASQELMEDLGIYMLAYDRAGYGESDPNPKRSVKSEVVDIQELADQLELGQKFYVIGTSMGGCFTWGCLKIAGAALLSPVVNHWWPSLPSSLSKEVFRRQHLRNQWNIRLAHYVPQFYSWFIQRFYARSGVVLVDPETFSPKDKEILKQMVGAKWAGQEKSMQQGEFESLHRDILVGFGNWGFDPLDLNNPFQHNESSVHIWQGDEDRMVSVILQRYVSERLPWIKYHEVPHAGHILAFTDNLFDEILKELLIGNKEPS
ncbi:Alpha/beta-Hydrolases superfamily protein [Thalictrum thalictroides]|uniref:Alpha/beta-Hydrolases superfamily protein n=1 Tax=Thalictrum thalictroides TaxID=46969 RepID=A0A7J6WND1_THATH|nr:Alpha/beta-Hydrolases superfamily protein [Thalictrum thalictroides]